MPREGRTLNKNFHIETRQHDLFNFDLGEGVPRRMLIFVVFVTVAWVLLLAPIVRMPNQYTFSLYVMPPVLFAWFGFRESDTQPRRRNITQWAIRLRYAVSGHKPIIGLGARSAYPTELLPHEQRWSPERFLRKWIPWLLPPEWETNDDEADDDLAPEAGIQAGRAIGLNQAPVVYGFDYMQQARERARRKATT